VEFAEGGGEYGFFEPSALVFPSAGCWEVAELLVSAASAWTCSPWTWGKIDCMAHTVDVVSSDLHFSRGADTLPTPTNAYSKTP
jgi:hypothetical protein